MPGVRGAKLARLIQTAINFESCLTVKLGNGLLQCGEAGVCSWNVRVHNVQVEESDPNAALDKRLLNILGFILQCELILMSSPVLWSASEPVAGWGTTAAG